MLKKITNRSESSAGPLSAASKTSQRFPSTLNAFIEPCSSQTQCQSSNMELSYVLGTNNTNTASANIYAYRQNQLIYYLKNMFVKYNKCTKSYRIFYELAERDQPTQHDGRPMKDSKANCNLHDFGKDAIKQDPEFLRNDDTKNTLLMSKYFPCGPNSLFAVLKKVDEYFYLSLFWVEVEHPALVIKVSDDLKEVYTSFTFHEKKGYIYLMYKKLKQQNSEAFEKQQYLKIIQIQAPVPPQNLGSLKPQPNKTRLSSKFKVLLNGVIKKTGGGFHDLDDLIVGADPSQLYMFGLDYFRQWTILYNEKTLKESNYRNTERNIKKEKIIQTFWVSENLLGKGQAGWKLDDAVSINPRKSSEGIKSQHNFLVIVTTIEVLFVRNNELIHISQIPDQSPFEKSHRETAELILQKSLNQIYKTKFRVDTTSQQNDSEEQMVADKSNKTQNRLTSASKPWIETIKESMETKGKVTNAMKHSDVQKQGNRRQQRQVKFCGAFNNNRIFIYKIQNDFSIKLETSVGTLTEQEGIIPKQSVLNKPIKNISTTPDGALILLTDSDRQNFTLSRNEDEESIETDPIYAAGQGHTSTILSISSPEVLNQMATVSQDGCLKIWNKSEKEKCLIIDTKFKAKPIQALMHPSGLVTIVNFGMEIKVYGIVSNQFQQIVAVKTNDYCSGMQYSKVGNFLVSNQKNMIKVYDPFTLHAYGKIQSEDLREQYKIFRVSDNNEYIIYQSNNYALYKLSVSSIFYPEQGASSKAIGYCSDQKQGHFVKPALGHKQSEQYTCFYFNFGTVKHNSALALEGNKNKDLSADNIFVGFTRTKFMVIYSHFAENLIAEFPVVNDVYVTDCCVADQLMFLGTNKGSILTYAWPIQESQLEIQVSNQRNEKGALIARLKPPKCLNEFKVWRDCSPITVLHKKPNNCELAVGGVDGILGLVTYNFPIKNGTEPESGQNQSCDRKRMIEATNNIKLVKIAEVQKISKLIEKTENDIQKIQYEVENEKNRKNKQLEREENQLRLNTLKRQKAYLDQRKQKWIEQEKELNCHQIQYEKKKKHLEKLMALLEKDCQHNSDYERYRIKQVETAIEEQKKKHRSRIVQLIETHKQNIQKLKQRNLVEIRTLQNEFEALVKEKYSQQETIPEVMEVSSAQLGQNQEISCQKLKVLELQEIIAEKSEQFAKISAKSEAAKNEDESMQKKFQRNLEKYNEYRYENLILHSELLKIQNQLYERKQILSKKDEIINMVYQQKQINETFKQFVSGAICGLEDQKQKAYDEYIKKEQSLRMLFQELTLEINKSEAKNLKLVELRQLAKIYERQNAEKTKNIQLSIEQLKNFKKYLLVQGVSQDTEHKKFYQEQEKLLSTIKWLQKRFRMNCINEKKMTVLKKSGVNQVINQNKNLLEECNQLREEGIIYENQIHHLSTKLAEANMIIQLEKKVTNQDNIILKQSEKLHEIRRLFNDQISKVNQQILELPEHL